MGEKRCLAQVTDLHIAIHTVNECITSNQELWTIYTHNVYINYDVRIFIANPFHLQSITASFFIQANKLHVYVLRIMLNSVND